MKFGEGRNKVGPWRDELSDDRSMKCSSKD